MSSAAGEVLRSILVVEDDGDARTLLASKLRDSGYHVLEAATVEAAMDVLRSCPCDAIVLDRLLPDGDGIDVARTLRRSGKAIPIVLVTASRESSVANDARLAGCDAFLRKPFPFGALLLLVEQACRATQSTERVVLPEVAPLPAID